MINLIEVLPEAQQKAWVTFLQSIEGIHSDNFRDPFLMLQKVLAVPEMYRHHQNVEIAYKIMGQNTEMLSGVSRYVALYKILSWYWLDKDPTIPLVGGLIFNGGIKHPIFSLSTELFSMDSYREGGYLNGALDFYIDDTILHKILMTAQTLFNSIDNKRYTPISHSNEKEEYTTEITAMVNNGLNRLFTLRTQWANNFALSTHSEDLLQSLEIIRGPNGFSRADFENFIQAKSIPHEEINVIV